MRPSTSKASHPRRFPTRLGSRRRRLVLLSLSLVLHSATSAWAEQRGSLVFSSGFEGVSIARYGSSQQHHQLRGMDSTTGFSFDQLTDQLEDQHFVYLVGPNRPDPWASTFWKSNAYAGARSLCLEVKDDHPDDSSTTRNEWSLFPKDQDGALFSKQGYARYRMKFRDDLSQSTWPSNWINFFEVKENYRLGTRSGENYRMNFHVKRSASGGAPFWQLLIQDTSKNPSVDQTRLQNKDVPVPIGKWFLVEALWKQHPERGRLYLAIDGKTVFDFRGRTENVNPTGVRFWSPLKNYRNAAWLAGDGRTNVDYDDLQLWTDFPLGEYREHEGEVVMQAEQFTGRASAGDTWEVVNIEGDSERSIVALNDNGTLAGSTQGPRVDYRIRIDTPGAYRLWARAKSKDSASDSFHFGRNGGWMGTVYGLPRSWGWVGGKRIDVQAAGVVTLNVWMREDGAILDKFVLIQDDSQYPLDGDAKGPEASPSGVAG